MPQGLCGGTRENIVLRVDQVTMSCKEMLFNHLRRRVGGLGANIAIVISLMALAGLISIFASGSPPVMAAGATTKIQVVKYAVNATGIIAEETVSYQWMEANLPVYGDGETQYYHQGPVFEGDMWDPSRTQNLKNKGAVMGTSVRDLCELVGGMAPGDEVRLVAIDGWSTKFAYDNIYEPLDRQGTIVLCWFKGTDPVSGDKYGTGYPGIESYNAAIQVVVMSGTKNVNGQYVFGNDDMRVCLPEEEYQHFYQGLPSTNGLSGKWITRVEVLSQEEATSVDPIPPDDQDRDTVEKRTGFLEPVMWVVLGCGVAGIVLISLAVYRLRRK
ncbi:MAG: argininosuccinate synthase [Dehalococcoidia bacterium]